MVSNIWERFHVVDPVSLLFVKCTCIMVHVYKQQDKSHKGYEMTKYHLHVCSEICIAEN